jgi:hypothetical protein
MITMTLRFYPPTTWWERLVSIGGRRLRFIHVDAAWQWPSDVWVVDSAPFRGPRILLGGPLYITGCHSVSMTVPAAVHDWIFRNLHQPYGWLDCCQALVRRWTGLRIGGNPRGVECAEFIADMLNASGLRLDVPIGVTPDELLDAVMSCPQLLPVTGHVTVTP